MERPGGKAPSPQIFATTHWTRVLEARGQSPEARSALADLCAAYYPPVFAYIRSHSQNEHDARDLTQEFFGRLLTRNGVDSVDPARGRFRSFLLGAVKHFLSDMRDRDHRLKRGGGMTLQSITPSSDTSPGIELADPRARGPDTEFDRQWALTVLDRALQSLQEEHAATGKGAVFEALHPWLTGDSAGLSQAAVATELGMNEGAVKVAIHRLRRHFRELVKAEISQTLRNPSDGEQELSCLIAALSAP